MRYMRYFILGLISLGLIVVSLANREMVTLNLLPEALGDLFSVNAKMELPLFIVIFVGIAVGLLIGFLWEWVREYWQRAEGRLKAREVVSLRRELAALKVKTADNGDDVLALLET